MDLRAKRQVPEKIAKGTNNTPLERQLIELVHKHPQLYDTGHEHYKDIEKRDKIWGEIAEELDLSMPQCKSKWRTLRDAFAKQYKLVQRSQITEDFSCVRFKNYEQLSFLKAFIKPRDPVITEDMLRAGGQDYHLSLTYNLMTGAASEDALLDDADKPDVLVNGDQSMDTTASSDPKLDASSDVNVNGYSTGGGAATEPTWDDPNEDDLLLFNEPQVMLTSSDTSITTERRRTVRGHAVNLKRKMDVEEDPIVVFFRSMGDVARSYVKEIQAELRERVLGLMLEAETKNSKLLKKGKGKDARNDANS
nr:PREDICTED: uncharacterized protein LOC109034165 [Bemisia tabaci]